MPGGSAPLHVLMGLPKGMLRRMWSRRPGRTNAAEAFGVCKKVLGRIGELSSNKGRAGAKKVIGSIAPYTAEEERFLKSAIRTLIRMAAEVEHGPEPSRTTITMADF